jgi:4-amino-4-deoxyprephenate dehydrogenase
VSPPRRAVVVGGRGAVGSMLTTLLRDNDVPTTIVDTGAGGPDTVAGDITAPNAEVAEAVGDADLVVLAVAEPVALRALDTLHAIMRRGAVLVDTLSVKSRFLTRLATFPLEVEHVGLNPMFAPDLGLAGRPVAAVVTRDGPGTAALLDLLARGGGQVVRCTGDEHDRTTAATQALTHATVLSFGFALARMGALAEGLVAAAPPPHVVLLSLLARITSNSPDAYLDIQEANPHAVRAREALVEGLRVLATAIENGAAGMAAAFDDLRGLLGTDFERHRRRGRELLTTTHRQAEEDQ